MKKESRIDTSGNANPLANNPFAGLSANSLPSVSAQPATSPAPAPPGSGRAEPKRNRGRVDVIRQVAGRGGKTVTVLTGFKGIAESELRDLARTIQRACGSGGTVKSGAIEIHGDQRDRACAMLEAVGFRPVRAGG